MSKNTKQKISLLVRIITIAPVFAFILLTTLLFKDGAYNNMIDYFIAVFSLCVLPVLAYPIQRKFKIIKGEPRNSERKLAVIFSCIGYILGTILCFILNTSNIQKVLFLTYLFSGLAIALFSLVNIKASGHMCGVTGPIAFIVYVFGYWYLFLGLILIPVFIASFELKRHKIYELFLGSVIPVISMIISILLII